MKALIVFLLAILASCSQQTVEDEDIPKEIEILFCPEDDCLGELTTRILKAEDVDCALYHADIPELLEVLERKHARLVTDIDNEKKIEGTKIEYRTNYGSQLMHNKFCVLDNVTVVTGSYNPTVRGAKDNNNVLIINSKDLAANYRDEFEEMWLGWYEGGTKARNPAVNVSGTIVKNYFCPEDCKYEAMAAVLEAIHSAKKSIHFMTFSFTDDNIGDSLIAKHREGVHVEGIFEKRETGQYSEYERLKSAGMEVVLDNNSANMHHKVFIIDARTVITGSWNPTKSGTEKNDENILIFENTEIAAEYYQEFLRIR